MKSSTFNSINDKNDEYRFLCNGDGTVTDNVSGLMWLESPIDKRVGWHKALKYCNSLVYAGYSDWRLPSKDELRSLCFCFCEPFFVKVFSGGYWTSTYHDDYRGNAYFIYIESCEEFYDDMSLPNFFWPVRNIYLGQRLNDFYEKKIIIQKTKIEQENCSISMTPGKFWTEPITGMDFAWVPGGSFMMGDVFGEFGEGENDERPVHFVEIDGFWIGKYPVTQEQWKKMMDSNPSYMHTKAQKNRLNNPIDTVSWNDAQEYIKVLNSLSDAYRFRLPTEAEWEYASRYGGGQKTYSGSDDLDSVAWYKNNSYGGSHPVGKKLPNILGIHDMSGNVWEWVYDRYRHDYYSKSPRKNPQGPTEYTPIRFKNLSGYYPYHSARVFRGGSWRSNASYCRVTSRHYNSPNAKFYNLGFRLAFSPDQQQPEEADS